LSLLPRWPVKNHLKLYFIIGQTGKPVYSCRKPKALPYNCQQTWIGIFSADFLILLTSAKTGVNEAAQGKYS
jgi:hypothetical protein